MVSCGQLSTKALAVFWPTLSSAAATSFRLGSFPWSGLPRFLNLRWSNWSCPSRFCRLQIVHLQLISDILNFTASRMRGNIAATKLASFLLLLLPPPPPPPPFLLFVSGLCNHCFVVRPSFDVGWLQLAYCYGLLLHSYQ